MAVCSCPAYLCHATCRCPTPLLHPCSSAFTHPHQWMCPSMTGGGGRHYPKPAITNHDPMNPTVTAAQLKADTGSQVSNLYTLVKAATLTPPTHACATRRQQQTAAVCLVTTILGTL
jgi:hypothetical protein